jgi:hypothetical protein
MKTVPPMAGRSARSGHRANQRRAGDILRVMHLGGGIRGSAVRWIKSRDQRRGVFGWARIGRLAGGGRVAQNVLRHRCEPDSAEMAARYGAEMTVPDLQARLVCGRWSSRRVDIGGDRRARQPNDLSADDRSTCGDAARIALESRNSPLFRAVRRRANRRGK